jgi:hypothetical protein
MFAIGGEGGQRVVQESFQPGADEGFERLRVGAADDIPEGGPGGELGTGKAERVAEFGPMIAGPNPTGTQAGFAMEQTEHEQRHEPGVRVALALRAAGIRQGMEMSQETVRVQEHAQTSREQG